LRSFCTFLNIVIFKIFAAGGFLSFLKCKE
jgi:hypothetical protein